MPFSLVRCTRTYQVNGQPPTDLGACRGTVTLVIPMSNSASTTATATTEPISVGCDGDGNLLGPDGDIGVVLESTEDPDTSPTGNAWCLRMTIDGTAQPPFYFQIPTGIDALDLDTVPPAAPPSPFYTYAADTPQLQAILALFAFANDTSDGVIQVGIGNPNTESVTPGGSAALYIDVGTTSTGIWQWNGSEWASYGGGGAGVTQTGYVQVLGTYYPYPLLVGGRAALDFTVAPQTDSGPPAGYVAQCPLAGQAWLPAVAVEAAGIISVALVDYMQTGLWDTVDMSGTIVVWDLTGDNLLAATWAYNGFNGTLGTVVPEFTQQQLIGSDLSLSDTGIVSAAGGTYNVLVGANAVWD